LRCRPAAKEKKARGGSFADYTEVEAAVRVGSMDIIAHALWTAAAGSTDRLKLPRPFHQSSFAQNSFHLGWAVFWGVFPDLFSFAVPAVVRIWWYATGTTHSLLPDAQSPQRFQYVWQLYNGSHSLVVFAVVFGLAWGIFRRPVWELLGWALHILIDIPTHTGIFSIHFLWPLSSFGFSGLRWENPWFLALNYGALVAMFGWIWWGTRRTERATRDAGARPVAGALR
jgi:hypothetical protein